MTFQISTKTLSTILGKSRCPFSPVYTDPNKWPVVFLGLSWENYHSIYLQQCCWILSSRRFSYLFCQWVLNVNGLHLETEKGNMTFYWNNSPWLTAPLFLHSYTYAFSPSGWNSKLSLTLILRNALCSKTILQSLIFLTLFISLPVNLLIFIGNLSYVPYNICLFVQNTDVEAKEKYNTVYSCFFACNAVQVILK